MSYPTPDEFWGMVKAVAKEVGYDVERPQHPEDLVASLSPIFEAVAAGWTAGFHAAHHGKKGSK